MESTAEIRRNRGSYYVLVGDIKEFKTQGELKTYIAENPESGVVIKGKEVNITIENKPVVSLDV